MTDLAVTPTPADSREDRAALDVLFLLRELAAVAIGSDLCDLCGCLCQPWESVCPGCRPVLTLVNTL